MKVRVAFDQKVHHTSKYFAFGYQRMTSWHCDLFRTSIIVFECVVRQKHMAIFGDCRVSGRNVLIVSPVLDLIPPTCCFRLDRLGEGMNKP